MMSCPHPNRKEEKRYNDSKQVTNYSDWKWTTNKNLPNAEYSGNTKVE